MHKIEHSTSPAALTDTTVILSRCFKVIFDSTSKSRPKVTPIAITVAAAGFPFFLSLKLFPKSSP